MDRLNRKEARTNIDTNFLNKSENNANFWYDRTNIEKTTMFYGEERAIISEDFKYVYMRFVNSPKRFRKRESIGRK